MKKKQLIFFCLFFVLTILFMITTCSFSDEYHIDDIWNYHMISKINNGMIPYNDIPMIIPPLYHYIGLLFFKVFGESFVTFYFIGALVSSLIVCLFINILNSICKKKLVIVCSSLCLIAILIEMSTYNYNTIGILLCLLIIKNEITNLKPTQLKSKKTDIINGILFALLFLTKHSFAILFGFFFLLYIVAVSIETTKSETNERLKAIVSLAWSRIYYTIISAAPIIRTSYSLFINLSQLI